MSVKTPLLPAPIESSVANDLLHLIDDLRHIPHSIHVEKVSESVFKSLTSIGIPEFNYQDYSDKYATPQQERMRVRVVERWMGDVSLRGIVRVQVQHVFLAGYRFQDKKVKLHDTKNDVDFDEYADDAPRKSVPIFGDVTKEDTASTETMSIAFLGNGAIHGWKLSRTDTNQEYAGGYSKELEDDMLYFKFMQPDLEGEYRASPVDATAVSHLMQELVVFGNEEKQLAQLRQAIGYKRGVPEVRISSH